MRHALAISTRNDITTGLLASLLDDGIDNPGISTQRAALTLLTLLSCTCLVVNATLASKYAFALAGSLIVSCIAMVILPLIELCFGRVGAFEIWTVDQLSLLT